MDHYPAGAAASGLLNPIAQGHPHRLGQGAIKHRVRLGHGVGGDQPVDISDRQTGIGDRRPRRRHA